ncbi:phage portal protein [Pantoea agglomerans]|uniref:phage portal protein n=1 Tax=Enterobacter agglomerans TaxID=549 RepID=UPI003C7BB31C
MAKFNKAAQALSALKQIFTASTSSVPDGLPFTSGHNVVVSRSGLAAMLAYNENAPGELTSAGDSIYLGAELPLDRLQRYAILEEMAKSPTCSAALNIHIGHALAPNKKTGMAFSIVARDLSDKEGVARAEELERDLGNMVNKHLPSLAMIMAIFGVAYVRPYAKTGVGITSLENSYYSLPYFIQEFFKGDQLVGFGGDYVLSPDNYTRTLSTPWTLVAMKNPYWTPTRNVQPIATGNRGYTLLSEEADKEIAETQNYGTSFLEHAYEPFLNLVGALNALKATRYNAAKIDRLIALTTNTLDPVVGANYTRSVTQTLKRHSENLQKKAINGNTMPTVMNHVIPVMGDGKNGITIDTQSIPADITGIEDVMFHLRQLCSALGIDSTMLGWADQMAGGLGEGGWIQTAIQAALRAQWIRQAAQEMIYRLIDIHLAFKYGKVYPENDRPYLVQFNSMNTAIQEEESRELDARANFVTLMVQIMDAIQGNTKLADNDTFMRYLFSEQLKMDNDTLDKMLAEFKKSRDNEPEPEDGGSMMNESAPADDSPENWTHEELVAFANFVITP